MVIASLIDLTHRGRYLHIGWFDVSYANLVVVAAMILVFAAAIVLPFPRGRRS
jgi:hypothetical protein